MAYKITLKNNISFLGDSETTIFDSAKQNGINLEHSCLNARCSSCKTIALEGEYESRYKDSVLSDKERDKGYLLTCNTFPKSDIKLNMEDLSGYNLTTSRTLPSKIDCIEKLTDDVIKLTLRLPPNANFKFLAGQYVNIIKGSVKRSYSIAGAKNNGCKLEFYIKNYLNGKMSSYFFNSAKENDLLRLEGPLGTFFLREYSSTKNIVFLATGTGIAPVRAILKELQSKNFNAIQNLLLLWGARQTNDFFWTPKFGKNKVKYIPVLSKKDSKWKGEFGYVQEVLMQNINSFHETEVYACGSNNMITSAKSILVKNGLKESHFFSDAFVSSN